ncbi:MICOS complex subunit MIC10 [Halyomorpha halys]|uniref:MICOS complex subunit MIC10 n=1 Tax=Halyomorpha halys TaxID=286706 RepID=UPI0006D4CE35|nr:MICOS complex subunit MIC10-like [Halyomorpha halys]
MAFEDDIGPRWDKCAIDGVKNIACGAVFGLILSTVIFKRKRWAFLLGVGFGLGMAYSACDYELNHRTKLPVCRKKPKSSRNVSFEF